MAAIKRLLEPLAVHHTDDAYASQGAHRWGNRDIYPIVKKERTYSTWAYFAYWATAGICITSWTLGSSMIGIGLTAGQACGAVLAGSTFASILGFLAGQAGRTLFLSFTMMGRATFGLYGSYFSILICVFESLIYFGIQAYYGGQAVVVVLNSIFPQFLHLKNTLPESAGITTQALLGFLIYFVFYVPIVFVPPHKIYRFLYPNFLIICVTFAGILGWAIHSNGGPGDLVAPALELSRVDTGFAIMSSICSVAGAYTGGSVRISDWTRFAKTRSAPVIPLFIAMPITVTLGALVGVLVTSAVKGMYGVIIWNPLLMLQHVQAIQYTPACRAGTFFAGAGLLSSQIFVNMTQNTVSCGMDLAGLVPKFLTMRRGGLLICVLGILIQPWRFLSQAQVFLTVLSSFGVFVAPMTGILITDFWIVRRQHWKIPDLFREDGVYWYTWGLNWRAFLCFFLGCAPSMPGFICAVNGDPIAIGWTRIYQLSYFVGLAIACPGYWILCRLSPPPALRVMEYMDDELVSDDDEIRDGRQIGAAIPGRVSDDGSGSGMMVEPKSSRQELGSRG